MINYGHEALQSAPFLELGDYPTRYAFAPTSQLGGAQPMQNQEGFMGAVGVSIDTEASSVNGALPLTPHSLTESFKDSPIGAAESLAEAHKVIVAALDKEPLDESLEKFKDEALAQELKSLYPSDHKLIGGLAVYDTADGYRAGVFASRNLHSAVKGRAINVSLLHKSYLKKYQDPPKELKELSGNLPVDSRSLSGVVDLILRAVIIDKLPVNAQLRREIGLDTASRPLVIESSKQAVSITA